jgi:hypothetical protein
MSLRRHARVGIALAAAYAVALQAVLLAFGVPGAGGVAAVPICSAAAGHSAPAGQSQDCLDACLTGCCSGAPICPTPAAIAICTPAPAQMLAAAPEIEPLPAARVANAHRSRAPPSA